MQQVAKFVEKITDQHYGWLKTYFYEIIDNWVRLYVENRKGEASPSRHFGLHAANIASATSPLFKQSISQEGKLDYVMVPNAEKLMVGWAEGQAKAALKAYAGKLDQKLSAIVGQKADFTINGSLKAHGGVWEGIITVTCSDNSSFDADTKMIINTSVHGKNFYQYPLLFRNVTMSDGTKMKKASEIQMLTTFLGNAELPKGTAAPKLSAGKKYDMLQAMLRALEAAGFEVKPGNKAYWISWQGKNMGMVKVSGKGAYESKSGISETDLAAFVAAMKAMAAAKGESIDPSEIDQRLALLARDRGTTVDAILASHQRKNEAKMNQTAIKKAAGSNAWLVPLITKVLGYMEDHGVGVWDAIEAVVGNLHDHDRTLLAVAIEKMESANSSSHMDFVTEAILGLVETKVNHVVAAKLKSLKISGADRVKDMSDDGADFRADKNGSLFQMRRGEEDDDHPEFVGRDKVLAQALAHFKGLDVDVDAWAHEKGYFTVSVTPKK